MSSVNCSSNSSAEFSNWDILDTIRKLDIIVMVLLSIAVVVNTYFVAIGVAAYRRHLVYRRRYLFLINMAMANVLYSVLYLMMDLLVHNNLFDDQMLESEIVSDLLGVFWFVSVLILGVVYSIFSRLDVEHEKYIILLYIEAFSGSFCVLSTVATFFGTYVALRTGPGHKSYPMRLVGHMLIFWSTSAPLCIFDLFVIATGRTSHVIQLFMHDDCVAYESTVVQNTILNAWFFCRFIFDPLYALFSDNSMRTPWRWRETRRKNTEEAMIKMRVWNQQSASLSPRYSKPRNSIPAISNHYNSPNPLHRVQHMNSMPSLPTECKSPNQFHRVKHMHIQIMNI